MIVHVHYSHGFGLRLLPGPLGHPPSQGNLPGYSFIAPNQSAAPVLIRCPSFRALVAR